MQRLQHYMHAFPRNANCTLGQNGMNERVNVVGFIELIIFFATESTCRDPNTCVRPSKLNQMNSLFCLRNLPTTIPLLK